MARIAKAHGKLKTPVETLIGSYFARKIWLMSDTISFLHKLGVRCDKIYEVAQFDRLQKPPFDWFAETVSISIECMLLRAVMPSVTRR